MVLARWEPFRDLLASQECFNRLFNDTLPRVFGDEDLTSRAWAPPVDIYETEQNVVLKAEYKGWRADLDLAEA